MEADLETLAAETAAWPPPAPEPPPDSAPPPPPFTSDAAAGPEGGPPGAPPGAGAGPRVIRVLDVRRTLTDLATAGPEELDTLLAELRRAAAAAPAGPLAPLLGALGACRDLARLLQGPLAPLRAPPGPDEADPGAASETAAALLVRALLANPAVRPLVVARGAAADAERGRARAPALRVRAAARARAVDPAGRDLALAAEEPALVVGFAVDPLAAGAAVLAALGPGAPLGADVYAASGAGAAAAQAAAGPVRPPEFLAAPEGPRAPAGARGPGGPGGPGPLARRGFRVAPLGDPPAAAPAALLRQARAAVAYYFSGAAAAAGAARVAAAAAGRPGAPPELLAALGPASAALAPPPPPPPTGPTWRPPWAAARLAYLLGRLAAAAPVVARPAPRDLAPLAELYRAGALEVYLAALVAGRDAPAVDAFLEAAAARQAAAAQLAALAARAAQAAARARQYVLIIEDKFGTARSRAVLDAFRAAAGSRPRGAPGGSLALPADAVQADDPAAVLALCGPREREVVETEHENRRRAAAAAAANGCPHVRLARRLRAAATAAEALATLQALAPYLGPPAPCRGPARGDAPGAPGRAPGLEWLACRACGFPALCPHVRERVELEARRASFDEQTTRLHRYAVRVRTGGDGATYYCRVCAERLGEADDGEDAAAALGRYGALGAGLRGRVWALALAAAARLRFPVPTDERAFAGAAADAVHPALVAAEEAGSRRRRRRRAGAADDEEEPDPRTQVYAALYVAAYALALIAASAGTPLPLGLDGVRPGAKLSAYAARLLALAAADQAGPLSEIEDVTPDFLRARFTAAYQGFRRAGEGLAAADPEEELAVQTTTVDPIYRYGAAVARLAGALPRERPPGPAGARREFEAVLGAALPAVVKLARASAKDPALAPLYLRRTGAEVPPGGALEDLLKDPRVNLFARLYEPPAPPAAELAAFRALAAEAPPGAGLGTWLGAGAGEGAGAGGGGDSEEDGGDSEDGGGADAGEDGGDGAGEDGASEIAGGARATGAGGAGARGAARPPPRGAPRGPLSPGARWDARAAAKVRPAGPLAPAERGAFHEAYRLFAWYTKRVVDPGARAAYGAALAAYRRSEDGLRRARARAAPRAYYDFGFAKTQRYAAAPVPLTALYDESGRPHDWGRRVTYVFAPAGGGPEREVRGGPEGAKKARAAGELAGLELADLVCPVCGARASALGALDTGAVARSLRALCAFDAFFAYYDARCPAGELHAWGGGTCGKCGLSAAVLQDRGAHAAAARAYYDAHAARYAAERRRAAPAPPPAPAPEPGAAAAAAAAAAWAPDYTLVVRAAELGGVPPALVEAIGAMEGRDYGDAAEGRDAPPPPATPADPRIYAADAEVRAFLADYAALRHALRFPRPPPAVAELLAGAGVPPAAYAALPAALPDVGAGYHAAFRAVLEGRPPADALAFAIQALCRMALAVAGAAGPEPWVAKLGAAFAARELRHLLRGQKLFSKPGPFNWAIFGGSDADEDAADPEQAGDVGEDALEELLARDTEEAPDDPFSGENADYDTSESNPNNEPS